MTVAKNWNDLYDKIPSERRSRIEAKVAEDAAVNRIAILRQAWARGDGGDNQPMHRGGKLDAVGYYLYRLCVPLEILKHRFTPGHLVIAGDALPDAARWLVSDAGGTSEVGWQIIAANDMVQFEDGAREAVLTRLFKEHGGVELEFEDL